MGISYCSAYGSVQPDYRDFDFASWNEFHFPFQSFELIQSLVHNSALAFKNSLLREKLEISLVTDYLSGLYTRRHLDEQIITNMQHGTSGAFLLFDKDDFKKVNDSFGHKAGDEIIIQVSHMIKQSIGSQVTAARWGGEELAVYIPGYIE